LFHDILSSDRLESCWLFFSWFASTLSFELRIYLPYVS